jgi:hypothetical protein
LSFEFNKKITIKEKLRISFPLKVIIIHIVSQNLRKGTNSKIAQITNTLRILEIDILLVQKWDVGLEKRWRTNNCFQNTKFSSLSKKKERSLIKEHVYTSNE